MSQDLTKNVQDMLSAFDKLTQSEKIAFLNAINNQSQDKKKKSKISF